VGFSMQCQLHISGMALTAAINEQRDCRKSKTGRVDGEKCADRLRVAGRAPIKAEAYDPSHEQAAKYDGENNVGRPARHRASEPGHARDSHSKKEAGILCPHLVAPARVGDGQAEALGKSSGRDASGPSRHQTKRRGSDEHAQAKGLSHIQLSSHDDAPGRADEAWCGTGPAGLAA